MNSGADTTKHPEKTIEQIISEASNLPLECQDWLLMLAKGMAYARKCISHKSTQHPDAKKH